VTAAPGTGHVPLAVDRNGELHDTHAIESTPASLAAPLRCADCGAALEAVRAHPEPPRVQWRLGSPWLWGSARAWC
jgi:hypothetical protein